MGLCRFNLAREKFLDRNHAHRDDRDQHQISPDAGQPADEVGAAFSEAAFTAKVPEA